MVSFEGKTISSNISIFDVYVKLGKNDDLEGSMFNETYGFALDFVGVREMLGTLDSLFNHVNFPMASHEERVFLENREKKYEVPEELYEASAQDFTGEKPCFRLHVQFRRNSTWQGMLQWIPMQKTKRFRSELELVRLILEALQWENDRA